MISSIQGTLLQLTDTGISLSLGFITLDVLTLAFDRDLLEKHVGSPITLHTLAYLEGDPNRGNLEPRLLGFTTQADRAFFELFTTVKGIWPQDRNACPRQTRQRNRRRHRKQKRQVPRYPQRRRQTNRRAHCRRARRQVRQFVLGVAVPQSPGKPHRNSDDEDAIQTLVTLGERRSDAEVASRSRPARRILK